MKFKLFTFLLLFSSVSLGVSAQGKKNLASNDCHFAKKDVMLTGGLGLAVNAGGGHTGAMISQKLSVDFGVCNFNKKTTLGVGFSFNNCVGDWNKGVIAGEFDYTFNKKTTDFIQNGRRLVTNTTNEDVRRRGNGTADVTYMTNTALFLANASLHHSFTSKFEGYVVLGLGAGIVNVSAHNFHNYQGFKTVNENVTKKISSTKTSQISYSYDDRDHATYDGKSSTTACFAASVFCGAHYWFNKHIALTGEVGLDGAGFRNGGATLDILKIGCTYKF